MNFGNIYLKIEMSANGKSLLWSVLTSVISGLLAGGFGVWVSTEVALAEIKRDVSEIQKVNTRQDHYMDDMNNRGTRASASQLQSDRGDISRLKTDVESLQESIKQIQAVTERTGVNVEWIRKAIEKQ